MARSVELCYIQSSFPVVSTLISVTTANGNTILMAFSSNMSLHFPVLFKTVIFNVRVGV